MNGLWIAIIIIALVLFTMYLVMSSTISVRIVYHHHQDEDDGELDVRALFGIVHVRRHLGAMKAETTKRGPVVTAVHTAESKTESATAPKNDDVPEGKKSIRVSLWDLLKDFRQWRTLYHYAIPTLKSLHKESTVALLNLSAVVGTGDAVSTGILCGSVWSVLSVGSGYLVNHAKESVLPKISVSPVYAATAWSVDADCIVEVGFGHAIVAAIRLFVLWRRRGPHGTPHSRVNAYRDV